MKSALLSACAASRTNAPIAVPLRSTLSSLAPLLPGGKSSKQGDETLTAYLSSSGLRPQTLTCKSLPFLTRWVCREGFCALRFPRLDNAARGIASILSLFLRPCARELQANGCSRFLQYRDRRRPALS